MNKIKLLSIIGTIILLQSTVAYAQSNSNVKNLLVSDMVAKGVPDTPQLRQAVAADLQKRDSILREAKKSGVDKNPQVRLRAEMAGQDVIIREYLADWLSRHPVSDEGVKKAYDVFVAQSGKTEYLVRDIVVPTEGDANSVVARLNAGEKFEVVASNVTQDMNARPRGGLQNWTAVGFIDPAIAKPLAKLSKGSWSAEPIRAENGWHIVELVDVRPFKAPSYESAKPQIKRDLEQKSVADYVKSLS